MNEVIFVILRRLRRPLIVLIIAYAISVWGLVLIPGLDKEGNVVHLGFFHALYIVSYTATTIGFGEIPKNSPIPNGCGLLSASIFPSFLGLMPSAASSICRRTRLSAMLLPGGGLPFASRRCRSRLS